MKTKQNTACKTRDSEEGRINNGTGQMFKTIN